ncbi:MAG: UPF0147 family protein [Candidatus Micrarchaeaceae archaeon]
MKDESELAKRIDEIKKQIDSIINDMSVPKNVRSAASEAKNNLNAPGDYTVRISNAIYSIDSISNDINLQPQARTIIWNILSQLESIKED